MSMTFKEIKGLDLPVLERETLSRWEQEDVFRQCLDARRDGPVFTFYEGPPTANGRPGIHHVLGRTIKDIFCRYKTMKGFRVDRKGGWDTHGLPVEIEVEKELGLQGRNQVEEYGIAKYNAACRESVLRYKNDWDHLTRRIAYWVDLDDPYITFKNDYIETVWWLVKQLHEKGLLYKGYKIQWYSPGSETVLSSHEVSLGYKEVDDPSVYIRFPLRDATDTAFLAWTTTPWTLVSNAGLAVGTDIDYVKVADPQIEGRYLVLARALLDILEVDAPEIIASYKGSELVGTRYQPLFETPLPEGDYPNAHSVVAADFVSTEDGTGVVHIAPAFGADDHEVGKSNGLPLINPVQPDGRFNDDVELIAGLWFKDADKKIARDLKQRDLLFKQTQYRHNYPHDWRKGTPLMSYPVESWFVRTTAVKDRLVELNNTIHWYPAAIGQGRFGDWLENNVDWALSRKRYWGTPLPIWVSDKPGSNHFEVIGSVAELRDRCGEQLPDDATLDLHRPYMDELTWPAPDGGTMRRVTDVMDVWFDSGAMPFAQWHYPFENENRFKENFPADFIAEGLDQTRGWFYTLHALATMVMDSVAYRNVIVNGLVLDENGEKMSKSKGNSIDPFEAIEQNGADVLRWYMTSNSPPWESMKFSLRGLTETRRKFFSTLENVYSFFASYANIDGFHCDEERLPVSARSELDQWIMSRLNTTIANMDAAFDRYESTTAARALETFVDDLSNWYIRRSRRRFWKAKPGRGGIVSDTDKLSAYQTTYECLTAIARLMAPVAPFFGDWLHRALNGIADEAAGSVHLADFPEVEDNVRDADLEKRMDIARRIVTATLLLRNKSRHNVRQPLQRILVVTGKGGVDRQLVEKVSDIILDEVNVEAIEYIQDSSDIVRYSAKPNFPKLGPRLGKLMGPLGKQVRELDHDVIARFLADNQLSMKVNGETVTLTDDDLEVLSEPVGDWLVTQDGSITVALDTTLTDELLARGLARESVNRIQNLRKQADLNLTDRITIQYQASPAIAAAITAHADWIRSETLALALEMATEPAGDMRESYDIDDQQLTIAISRVTG
ncbi:isoleucyl-tRNA synthetase [Methylohalomonas lacus]|uniref:Isoleucine--tRNA ligase n=1 Tax=Methylohalomonas lacus TaxID=398773 RepID=A0AAE3L1X9_9GAMM|nr:isoleucine--tRNA ligase [Methylohalomonas lacus]MCS3904225.1 isoleucyl-tRNA synthetase [Methylohalomonas lacus]